MLPNNKNYFKVLLNGLTKLVHGGINPVEVIRAILWLWARKVTPEVLLKKSQGDLVNEESVRSFATWLGESEILVGAFWLSSAYASLIDDERRKTSAMFFTPPDLADRMIRNAGKLIYTGKIIDPACGGAAFLVPAAQAIAKHLSDDGKSSEEIVSYMESHLVGIDSEPFLCELSCAFLYMVLADYIVASQKAPKFNVICADGLAALSNELHTFDLVLSNPPYRKMTGEEVKPLRADYGSIISGQPNIYSVFIKRSTDLLKPGGKAVLLTPMSFLSGKSFSKLRNKLVTDGRISQLDLIHDKQGVFLWAEQDAVVTVWEKGINQDSLAKVSSLSLGGRVEFNGELLIPKIEYPWPIPRNPKDVELLPLFSKKTYDLKKYGYIPKTGAVVVHRDKRERYSSLAKAKKARKLIPLIWQRDIGANGHLKFDEDKCAEGQYIDVGSLESAAIIKKPSVALQRVTSSDQSHRLNCAPIPEALIAKYGGVIGENHVGFLEQLDIDVLVTPELLCAILRTKTLDRLFRCISGTTNVSSYELNSLPLPDPSILIAELKRGRSIEQATRIGFGLDPDAYGVPK